MRKTQILEQKIAESEKNIIKMAQIIAEMQKEIAAMQTKIKKIFADLQTINKK